MIIKQIKVKILKNKFNILLQWFGNQLKQLDLVLHKLKKIKDIKFMLLLIMDLLQILKENTIKMYQNFYDLTN